MPQPHLGVEWEEVPGNPILPLATCPHWNCLGLGDPWIGRGPDGDLLMWMSAGGDQGDEGPVVARARAREGLEFAFEPDRPVLLPADGVWDKWRETVSLHFDAESDRWTAWYLGYAVSFFDDPGLGQARSLDSEGIEWERPAEPIYRPTPDAWDHAFLSDTSPVRGPDGTWRLYYIGAGTTVGVGLLTSTDAVEWEPHPDNPVFERDLSSWDQGMLGVSVRYLGGRYVMWYAGYEEPLDLETTPISIGLATSDDGVSWERHPDNPVLEPGPPGSWNDLRVVSPEVLVEPDGSLLMAAHGQSEADIGLVVGRIGLWRSIR